MTTDILYSMLIALTSRVETLEKLDREPINSKNKKIAELEDQVYKLQREQYRMKCQLFRVEVQEYFENQFNCKDNDNIKTTETKDKKGC